MTDQNPKVISCGIPVANHGLRVEQLQFGGLNMAGTVATELGLLDQLVSLSLNNNMFSGTLPSELALLTNLNNFDVSGNRFTGAFPDVFSVTSSAFAAAGSSAYFDVHANNLTGVLGPNINMLCAYLPATTYDFSCNFFTSPEPYSNCLPPALPSCALCNSRGPGAAAVSNNIPPAQCYAPATGVGESNDGINLRAFKSGLMSTGTANLTSWSVATKPCTAAWAYVTCAGQRVVSLSIAGESLAGPIASQLGALDKLVALDLSFNALSGTIPSQLALFTAITTLDLSNNYLTGLVPSQLQTACGTHPGIDVTCNYIMGPTVGSPSCLINQCGTVCPGPWSLTAFGNTCQGGGAIGQCGAATLNNISPTSVVYNTPTTINLNGAGFAVPSSPLGSLVRCVLNPSSSPVFIAATVVSSILATCQVTLLGFPAEIAITNTGDVSAISQQQTISQFIPASNSSAPVIASLTPPFARQYGAVDVVVVGSNFVVTPSLVCVINSTSLSAPIIAPAASASPTQLTVLLLLFSLICDSFYLPPPPQQQQHSAPSHGMQQHPA